MSRLPFVDVSENQGRIDFAKMRAADVEYIIIRAWINERYDKRLDEYVNGARAAGITVLGLYGFINPKSVAGAEQQAQLGISACQRYGVRMLMLDLEAYVPGEAQPPALSGQAYMAWLERLAAPIRAAGLYLTVYTNASYWNPLFVGVGSSLTDCDVIVATYPWYSAAAAPRLVDGYSPDEWEGRAFTAAPNGPATPAGFDHWDAWQFSAGFNRQGPVYGASSGDLDLNFADEAAVARWLGPLDPQEDDVMSDAQYDALNSKIDALRTEVAAVRGSALTAQGVFDAVLSLLRSDEIVALLHSHTPDDLAQVAKAVVAALPPGATGGLTADQVVDALVASEDFQQCVIKAMDRLQSDTAWIAKRA